MSRSRGEEWNECTNLARETRHAGDIAREVTNPLPRGATGAVAGVLLGGRGC